MSITTNTELEMVEFYLDAVDGSELLLEFLNEDGRLEGADMVSTITGQVIARWETDGPFYITERFDFEEGGFAEWVAATDDFKDFVADSQLNGF